MQKKVEFKVGKHKLRGSIFIPKGKGPFPGVIFFHGSESAGETYFELAERLSARGILGFAFNYRGCGISDGNIKDQTIGMGLDDASAAMQVFLSQNSLDKKRMGISGTSYGGFLASLITSKHDFKSLVLIAPAAYPNKWMNFIHGTQIIKLENGFNSSESYKQIERFQESLLIIRVEFEDVLPKGMAERYFEVAIKARKKEDFLLKGARHRIKLNPGAKEEMIKKVINWFLETL